MGNRLASLGLVGILAFAGAGNIACTSSFIPFKEMKTALRDVETKQYVALFEGLQPCSGYRMKKIAKGLNELGVVSCATSGNPAAHMPLIRKAHKFRQRVSIGGFSLGEVDARSLTKLCEDEGIKMYKVFLIDGVDLGTVHGSVEEVIDICGRQFYVFGRVGRYNEKDLDDKSAVIKHYDVDGSHLDIPENARNIIFSEILYGENRPRESDNQHINSKPPSCDAFLNPHP
ncbi:MAG: hypothetical protein KJ600_03175 [Nanoarchaeota archaeon]|nr:hypothetical protein [Nanoarchaeota archaeon]MBU1103529.1 hypothetical protein [Nanoarchaeota archaeon]